MRSRSLRRRRVEKTISVFSVIENAAASWEASREGEM